MDGKQYMIPWDWGYGSLLYRTDKIDGRRRHRVGAGLEPQVHGQDLAVERRVINFEIAALMLGFPDIDNPTSDEIDRPSSR